jgi:uncharacterized Ntn-hydrolase superfamily protein
MLGVAVSSAVPAVGALCPYIRRSVGAVSTQSWVNPYLAIEALDLIEQGMSAADALDAVIARDAAKDLRQIGVVDARGIAAAWSGRSCTPWFGHIIGEHFAVQGNMLSGESTLTEMARAFRASEFLDLGERLLLALEAGQTAGGDKRGRQSAALKVYHTEDYAWLDLRVDEHHHPVAELRRVYAVAKLQLLPFVEGMPKKNAEAGALPDHVSAMLLMSPPHRPGGGGSVA